MGATTLPPTLGAAIACSARILSRARIPDARAEAEFLAAGLLGLDRAQVLAAGERALTPAEARRWRDALGRRLSRVPLAYVLGSQPFLDLELEVGPGVFIPRPETEELVEAVCNAVERRASRVARRPLGSAKTLDAERATRDAVRILDLCTGSGAIAIALARRLPGAAVTAVDASPVALACARRNARRHGARVRFYRGDLFGPLPAGSRFAAIVSNPPYVRTEALARIQPEVRREPRPALDGGPRGLDVLERIVAGAPGFLAPGGLLALEMDPAQTGPVARRMRDAGFDAVAVRKDLQGRKRIVLGILSLTGPSATGRPVSRGEGN